VVLSTFDQENHDRILKEDSLEKGKKIGKELGEKIGEKRGKELGKEEMNQQMNQLILHLKKDNRIDDLIRSATDPEFQKKLLEEYKI
jgi:flagellar biosynthesis/type III secretory pathway protein FliH